MIKCICPGWRRSPIAPPAVSGSQGTRAGPPCGCRRAGINDARGPAPRGRESAPTHFVHIWGRTGALLSSFPLIYKRSCHQKRGACLLNRSIRRDLRDLAFIYICTGSYAGAPNGRLSLDTAVLAFHDGSTGFEHLIAKLNRPRLGVYTHNGLGTAGTQ